MKVTVRLLFCAAALILPLSVAAQDPPTLTGYVLEGGSASFRMEAEDNASFSAEADTVLCKDNGTTSLLEPLPSMQKNQRLGVKVCQLWTAGRHLKVWGKRDRRRHTVEAERIAVDDLQPESISGYALIDRLLQTERDGAVSFRADGYTLHATAATKLVRADTSVATLAAVTTNMWVRYSGKRMPDSSVQVTVMTVTPNAIAPKESKLREKSHFDAAAVKESDRQGSFNQFFTGLNAKRIPAYDDPAMQARITRIGGSLIPAYQKALPADDPSRLDFTFQLVDLQMGPEAIATPDGIILVPYQILDVLNDAQLAAVLATNIGTVLQKQSLRFLPTAHELTAAKVLGVAAGVMVPAVYLATAVGTNMKESAALKLVREQDQRVGMCLMHDAGYDLTEAPMAWWLLHSKPTKVMPNGNMPPAAGYAYHLLGTVSREGLIAKGVTTANKP